jgi:hypothetical protein
MPGKRRKTRDDAGLQKLLHLGHVSVDGLATVLKVIRENPSLADAKRWELAEANSKEFLDVAVTIKLPGEDGGEIDWTLCDPNMLLTASCEKCPFYAKALKRAVARHPPSSSKPWRLIIVFDEFVPGDQKDGSNSRKTMVLLFTFAELGRCLLSDARAWMIPITVRTSVISLVRGGWSTMMCRFLHMFLFGSTGISIAGCPLILGGDPMLLIAKLECLMGDGEGLKLCLGWKGATSLHPCFRHPNVWAKGSEVEIHGHVEHTCTDASLFVLAGRDDLHKNQHLAIKAEQRYLREEITQELYGDILTAVGLNPHPDGVLADALLTAEIDFRHVARFDWVHTLLQEGVMSHEMVYYVQTLEEKRDVQAPQWEQYLKYGWSFPAALHHKGKGLHRLFNVYRAKKREETGSLKAGASELLSLYTLVRHYVEKYVRIGADIAKETDSFNKCCKTVDIILAAKRGEVAAKTSGVLLRNAHSEYMAATRECYGTDHLKPKSHWVFDIADQLETMEVCIDTYPLERNHIGVKAVASHIRNLRCFEASLLSSVVTAQRRALCEEPLGDRLIGSTAHLPNTAGQIKVADKLTIDGLVVAINDVVFKGDQCGKVLAALQEEDRLFVIVKRLVIVGERLAHSKRYALADQNSVWPAEALSQATAWYSHAETSDLIVVHD